MKKLLVSIVVPVFNAEKYLPECIGSLISQSYENIEIIVVDDGSTDKSAECLQKFQADARVNVITQKNSGGPAKPRNTGVNVARGELVFFFDADDVAHPSKIEESVAQFSQARDNRPLLVTNFEVFDECERRVVDHDYFQKFDRVSRLLDAHQNSAAISLNAKEAFELLLRHNFIGTSGVAARKEALVSVGGFDETISNGDDYDMWLKLSRENGLLIFRKVLHRYRRIESSISARPAHILAASRLQVLMRQKKHLQSNRQKVILKKRCADNYSVIAWSARKSGAHGLSVRASLRAIACRPTTRRIFALGGNLHAAVTSLFR